MIDVVLSLVLGVAVSVIVGRVLRAAGRPVLDDVIGDDRIAEPVARLLTVMFYLFSLGAALLVSTFRLPAELGWLYATAIKVGVVLLLVGFLHGATLFALLLIKWRRSRRLAVEAIFRRREDRERRTTVRRRPRRSV